MDPTLAIDAVAEVEAGYARGWSFTPLRGKRPYLANWQSRAREPASWPTEWVGRHGLNVGLRTGQTSGVVVIDIESDSSFSVSDFPATVTAVTGGGGWHLYYQSPKHEVRNASDKARGIDIRGDGGQVVFVGSVHPQTQQVYRWADGLSPDDVPLAEFPAQLAEDLSLMAGTPRKPSTPQRRTLRDIVIDRMRADGITRNRLAVMVKGRVGRSHVYEFIDGSRDITSAKLDAILEALDIRIG